MVEVREVVTKKQQKDFLNFPLILYKNNEYFVPPLYSSEKKIFNKNYVYYDTCKAKYYNAYIDGKIVGRISAIIQNVSNDKWNEKRVRFTRFDCIDNQEVANALFNQVVKYAKANNMNEIVGPLGFSDLEREGLLIEGFDQLSTFEEQYNYPYYQKLIENYGFEKEIDWLEHKLFLKKDDNNRLEKYCDLILKRYNLRIIKVKNINKFIKEYGNQFFDLIDETYSHIYGSVPFTNNTRKMMIANFKLIVKGKYVSAIVDENNTIVCAALSFPSIAKAVQKSSGKLTISAIIRLLKALNKPKVLDLALIGVVDKYAKKGVASSLILCLKKTLQDNPNIIYAETNLTLENNYNILNQLKNFDMVYHKRRRSFVKKI